MQNCFRVLAFITLNKITIKICIYCFICKCHLDHEFFLFANSPHFRGWIQSSMSISGFCEEKNLKNHVQQYPWLTFFCQDMIKTCIGKKKNVLGTTKAHPKYSGLLLISVGNEHPSEFRACTGIIQWSFWSITPNFWNLTTINFN